MDTSTAKKILPEDEERNGKIMFPSILVVSSASEDDDADDGIAPTKAIHITANPITKKDGTTMLQPKRSCFSSSNGAGATKELSSERRGRPSFIQEDGTVMSVSKDRSTSKSTEMTVATAASLTVANTRMPAHPPLRPLNPNNPRSTNTPSFRRSSIKIMTVNTASTPSSPLAPDPLAQAANQAKNKVLPADMCCPRAMGNTVGDGQQQQQQHQGPFINKGTEPEGYFHALQLVVPGMDRCFSGREDVDCFPSGAGGSPGSDGDSFDDTVQCPLWGNSCCMQGTHRTLELMSKETLHSHIVTMAGVLSEVRVEQQTLKRQYMQLHGRYEQQQQLLGRILAELEAMREEGDGTGSRKTAVATMQESVTSGNTGRKAKESASESLCARKLRQRTSSAAMLGVHEVPSASAGPSILADSQHRHHGTSLQVSKMEGKLKVDMHQKSLATSSVEAESVKILAEQIDTPTAGGRVSLSHASCTHTFAHDSAAGKSGGFCENRKEGTLAHKGPPRGKGSGRRSRLADSHVSNDDDRGDEEEGDGDESSSVYRVPSYRDETVSPISSGSLMEEDVLDAEEMQQWIRLGTESANTTAVTAVHQEHPIRHHGSQQQQRRAHTATFHPHHKTTGIPGSPLSGLSLSQVSTTCRPSQLAAAQSPRRAGVGRATAPGALPAMRSMPEGMKSENGIPHASASSTTVRGSGRRKPVTIATTVLRARKMERTVDVHAKSVLGDSNGTGSRYGSADAPGGLLYNTRSHINLKEHEKQQRRELQEVQQT